MKVLLRCLGEYRSLWRLWLPLLVATALVPLVVAGMPLVEKQFIDGAMLAGRTDRLAPLLAIYAALWLLNIALSISGALLGTYLRERVTTRLRQRLFAHASALSVAFSFREHSGRTLSLFVSDVTSVGALFGTTVVGAVGSTIMLVTGVVVMFSLNWQLAVAASLLPPVVAGLAGVLTRPLRPVSRRLHEKAAELNERVQENLTGIREVVAFGRERTQMDRFRRTLDESVTLRMRMAIIDVALSMGQSALSLTVALAIMGIGGYLVITGQTTLGTLVAMRSLFAYVFQPAMHLIGVVTNTQKSLAGADRIYEYLDRTPQVQERPSARPPAHGAGAVAFDRVSFNYVANRPVLHDISFTAQPGQLVAIVGPSGAGKSTIASLIARFYDPSSGRVMLDGVDLRDLTLEGLRAHIATVFQDTFLFATSIGENIAFGREGARETEIIAAARSANAWEFIEQLPQGLDTPAGERGVQLSEGQKQRISIARALLRDPRILILDEPTSALDARSEHLLQSALDNLLRGRTTFVIAHRLATVLRADQILVVDGGRIVERGTHQELLQRRGLYWELFALQFAGAGAAPGNGASPHVEALAPVG